MAQVKVTFPEGVEIYGRGHYAPDEIIDSLDDGSAEALEIAGYGVRTDEAGTPHAETVTLPTPAPGEEVTLTVTTPEQPQ